MDHVRMLVEEGTLLAASPPPRHDRMTSSTSFSVACLNSSTAAVVFHVFQFT